jgi:hypothetical protein
MEFIKDIGIAGFLFFLIKGIVWIILFVLVYFGLIDKERVRVLKAKMSFWKKNQGGT